jgi:hypothetical protein
MILRARVVATALILTATTGCGDHSHRLETSAYVLQQAAGARLGMTMSELTQVRPKLIEDENGLWESVGRFRTNSYVFAEGPIWRGFQGTLKAIIIDRTVLPVDSAAVAQQVLSTLTTWSGVAGAPTDSLTYNTPAFSRGRRIRQKLTIWCKSDALLLLVYESSPQAIKGHTLVRAIIQSPEYRLPAGYGIPYHEIRCN